jgi:hypothetical protein
MPKELISPAPTTMPKPNKKVRQAPTFSGTLQGRLQKFSKDAGIKDTDVIRVAVDVYLAQRNY